MRRALLAAARAWLISPAECGEPFDVRLRLTSLLFSRLSNIVMVGATGLLFGVCAVSRDHAGIILDLSVGGFLCIMLRCAIIAVFNRRRQAGRPCDPDNWTMLYGITACVSSTCWGIAAFITLKNLVDPVICLFAVVYTTATAGATAARNAAAPRAARLQLLLSLLPTAAGTAFMDDPSYRYVALAILILIVGLFGVISDLFAQMVALFETQMKLESLSNTDFLTQIPNRRSFGQACATAIARRQSAGEPFTILMVDVDHFKRFNDFYGHPAGDACLQQIASLLQANLRGNSCIVSRYGGEEFAVLLSGAAVQAGRQIAQRLCDCIAAAAIAHANRPDGFAFVTISIGVAAATGQESGCAAIVKSADDALYRAKQAGRNRISS